MHSNFPIVCVGGSAGGLDAYVKILKGLRADTGAAIVIVTHNSRSPDTLHTHFLRYTAMPVELISQNLRIRPNHVYVIPSNFDLYILDGAFRLELLSKPKGWSDVLTIFLRSLAQNWTGKLIAVVVSGLDSDGSAAMGEIKAVGGITIVQTPETAEWSDMPENAIRTGHVDFVLPAEEIALKIEEIAYQDTA